MRFVLLGIPISLIAGMFGMVAGLLLGLMVVAAYAVVPGGTVQAGHGAGMLRGLVVFMSFVGALVGIVVGWRILLRAPDEWLGHRHDIHTCAACQYDLTGNQTGACPECGRAIPHRQQRYIRKQAHSIGHA